MGHALVARMANQLLRGGAKTKYGVKYYGPHGSTIINTYEYMDVHQNVVHHVDIVGGELIEDAAAGSGVDMEIIAITALDQVQAAVERLATNGEQGLPSILIDFVGKGPANVDVAEALLNSPYTGRVLGYSAWNTPGNKIGLAVGMAQSRYALITTENMNIDCGMR